MAKIVALDVETTSEGGSPMPYIPGNKLVSVAWTTLCGEKHVLKIDHSEGKATESDLAQVQELLDSADILIGHNFKFDLMWLRECGFTYYGKVWDTSIYEYLASNSLKKMPSLNDALLRLELPVKKDAVKGYWDEGYATDDIPWDVLGEYNLWDADVTLQLYNAQLAELKKTPLIRGMLPTLKMMNEFLPVLCDMERKGIAIDLAALDKVETEFRNELETLEKKLAEITAEVMGDTPVNLNSQDDLNMLFFSRKPKDKKQWADIFNLGKEAYGGSKRDKKRRWHSEADFRRIINKYMHVQKRTDARHCQTCDGEGRVMRYTKKGVPYKVLPKCHTCKGSGTEYVSNGTTAGLRLKPINYKHAAVAGFKTDKNIAEYYLSKPNISDNAKRFLTAYTRYNAVSSYLSTFVAGIRNNHIQEVLHTNFNQTSTVTGRLSSTAPNLQNFPRGKTFPVRSAFTTRWDGGTLIDVDFTSLEFVGAGLVSGDKRIIQDIAEGLDVHTRSATIITEAGQPLLNDDGTIDRQAGKAYTFKPLFGGRYGTAAEMEYYAWFRQHYAGMSAYQDALADYAAKHKHIVSPSGRVYGFPYIRRTKDGSVNQYTQICNYIVQGFATGDIVPCTIIELYNIMRKAKMKSYLVLTVHDSIVVDVYPGEREKIIELVQEAFAMVRPIIKERYNIDSPLPFGYEMEEGKNLLDKQKIKV